jgi:hypothetical protein
MLPLRLSYVIRINVFGEIWNAHMSLGFSRTNSKGQTFRFHTLRFEQGI